MVVVVRVTDGAPDIINSLVPEFVAVKPERGPGEVQLKITDVAPPSKRYRISCMGVFTHIAPKDPVWFAVEEAVIKRKTGNELTVILPVIGSAASQSPKVFMT